jgi:hypothetical protein
MFSLKDSKVGRIILRYTACLAKGHPCESTGRHAIFLREWKCTNCGGTYVSHVHHGNILLPADRDSDQLISDCSAAIKKFSQQKGESTL